MFGELTTHNLAHRAGNTGRTSCGNWVELNKEPGQSQPSGFPHAMYKTDAQQQMLEGLLLRPKRFGRGLPPPEDPNIDYSRALNYDKRQGDSQWAAITSTEFVAPGSCNQKGREFASTFKLAGGVTDPNDLKEYRDTWTVEADSVRLVRFKTDAVTSANSGVPAKFRVGETRKLPGKPKAVERLRAEALARGNMGVVKLRQALQQRSSLLADGLLQPKDLVEGLKGLGLSLDEADTNRVIQFFSRGFDCVASIPDIFRGMSVPMSERRRRAVIDAFKMLDEAGKGVLIVGDLRRRFTNACSGNNSNSLSHKGEEARQAFLDHWPLYQGGELNGVTSAGFEEFLADVSCGVEIDDEFETMVSSLVGK